MRFAWGWALVSAGCAVVVVAACVGDDPTTGGGGGSSGTPGELGQPCNEGRCLADLICDPENVCRRAEGGTGPGPEAGDDGAGPIVDGGADADDATITCSHEAGLAVASCPGVDGGTCPATTPCCVNPGFGNSCALPEDCTTTFGSPFACNGKENCLGPEQCCFTLNSVLDASVCPATYTPSLGIPATHCAAACGKDSIVCRSNAQCDAGQICNRVVIQTAAGPIALGVCN